VEEQAERLLEASQEEVREQLLQSIQRGRGAEALLGNPVLVAWWEDYQVKAFELLDQIPLNDTVARDRLYTTLALLRKLRGTLEQFVTEGKTSSEDLANYLELKKKGLIGRLFSE